MTIDNLSGSLLALMGFSHAYEGVDFYLHLNYNAFQYLNTHTSNCLCFSLCSLLDLHKDVHGFLLLLCTITPCTHYYSVHVGRVGFLLFMCDRALFGVKQEPIPHWSQSWNPHVKDSGSHSEPGPQFAVLGLSTRGSGDCCVGGRFSQRLVEILQMQIVVQVVCLCIGRHTVCTNAEVVCGAAHVVS